MSKIRKDGLSLAVVLLMAGIASAQVTSSLRGTVTDPSGAVVPGAAVALTSPDTGVKRTTEVTKDGVYQFLQVPPGKYTLSVEAEGFRKTALTGIQLLVKPSGRVFLAAVSNRECRDGPTACQPIIKRGCPYGHFIIIDFCVRTETNVHEVIVRMSVKIRNYSIRTSTYSRSGPGVVWASMTRT